jgi:anti-sigma regulatory factor (Ser/Thr protein kinase)
MPAPTAPRTASKQPCPGRLRSALVRPPGAFLGLGAVLTAAGCARAWTREVLWERGVADLADTADIVVSELATNALRASRREGAAFFTLVLTRDRGELTILVRDFCPGVPQAGDAGEEDENGRGLLLVQELSARSGWYPAGDGSPGKTVWAVLEAPPAASGDPAAP